PTMRANFRFGLRLSCNAKWRRCAELGQQRGTIAAMLADFGRPCRKDCAHIDGAAQAESDTATSRPAVPAVHNQEPGGRHAIA
ncbi:UNVERIFIED_CONTAM: hypothetical protein NY603_20620, partial [Bacteroidetes bacterium 56_B9]